MPIQLSQDTLGHPYPSYYQSFLYWLKRPLLYPQLLPGFPYKGLVRCFGKTGVEMEALTSVSVALLTIYDMCKSFSKNLSISQIMLLKKSGGKSGNWSK